LTSSDYEEQGDQTINDSPYLSEIQNMKQEIHDEEIEDPDMGFQQNDLPEAPMADLNLMDSGSSNCILDQDMQKLEDDFMTGKIDLDFSFPIENIYKSLLI
jgi:hypothetical protein